MTLIRPSDYVIVRASHLSGGVELHEAKDCPQDDTCPVWKSLQEWLMRRRSRTAEGPSLGHALLSPQRTTEGRGDVNESVTKPSEVETENSTYIFDWEESTVTRVTRDRPLRKDNDALPLLALHPVEVGQPMVMELSIVPDRRTIRHTTRVTRVTP